MAGTVSSVLVILRHSLRLTGQEPPADRIAALEASAKTAGFSPEVFKAILKLKNGGQSFGARETGQLMSAYLDELDKAAQYIDGLQ
jgi:hypothetical protein